MANKRPYVFISYSALDKIVADEITLSLENSGIRCWIAPRDVKPGEEWAENIVDAIDSSSVLILVLSKNSNSSAQTKREIELAVSRKIIIIPFRIENFMPSDTFQNLLSNFQMMGGFGPEFKKEIKELPSKIRKLLPNVFLDESPVLIPNPVSRRESKGYVFISYIRSDGDFIQQLRTVFETKKYGYWDYVEGNRDYHGILYRELEERIDGSVAFMTIVSDEWRKSDWVASEFIYAKEARIPIFVIQARLLSRPLPILLNLQTRIDMSEDFDVGAEALVQELSKKGL